jgi:hypothetical protein
MNLLILSGMLIEGRLSPLQLFGNTRKQPPSTNPFEDSQGADMAAPVRASSAAIVHLWMAALAKVG